MRFYSGIAAVLLCSTFGMAQVIPEIEANDSKLTATPATFTSSGGTITGISTGTSTTVPGSTSADYFLVTTPASTPGIYLNRLTLTSSTAGHIGTIRGLGQTATNTGNSTGPGIPNIAALDNTFQTSSTTTTPARFNQFYTFGAAASLYYRVTGTTSTTADYTATFTQSTVTPTALGIFSPGAFTFTNTQLASTQDTEVLLYNANGTPVLGALNDDFLDGTVTQTGGSTLNSLLTRTLAPGTYYLAISNFNTADNQLSPTDEGTATGTYLDFPGVVANSSTTTFTSIPFNMITPDGTTSLTVSKPGAYDVWFATFTVAPVPEPTSMILLVAIAWGLFRFAKSW